MKNNSSLKISFLFALLLSSFFGFAQYTAIPDPNFEQALIDLGIDSGVIDHQVLTANISNVTSLEIPGKNIVDLTGIQDFLALIGLTCSDNGLSTLDISKNTALTIVNCGNNHLTSLNVGKNTVLNFLSCFNNKLTSLDFTENTALVNLYCSNNLLNNLNVTKNSALTYLLCPRNKLTSLDVTKNNALVSLDCSTNQLTSVDINKNTALTYFACSFNQLTSLDVSKNNALTDLFCTTNQLTNLDVTKNTLLKEFTCWNNQITNLDVSKNTSLNLFFCDNNQISTLDVSKNTSLTMFACSNNQLTSLNLKNGNNTNFSVSSLLINANPNLTCIQVDNDVYSNNNWSTKKDASASYSNSCNAVAATAPMLKSTGNQLYCPQTNIKIVEDFSITHDPAETGTEAIYIQISSGYAAGLDKLELSNLASHPSVVFNWDPSAGKLTLSSATGGDVLYSELELAIKDVVFSNSSATASGNRTFSITLGQANYLPSTQHYYQYIPSVGISWTNAKAAAESDPNIYYGIRGYLATILSADEAKLIGEQASGTGWIGGSDAETESVWKWVTGPEAGTVFWNGNANGSTPNYAFWNNGEPNQQGDEDYAHITQPGVGLRGSWNDLSNTGDLSGNYQPKGYIVEYGGMPGDPVLQIATSTKITIPVINTLLTPNPVCDSGSFTLNATATTGATIRWYDAAIGGNLLATGATYTTPTINTTTIYYADAGCETNRKSVTAVVNKTPDNPVATSPTVTRCGAGTVTLEASSNVGTINWFTDASGGTSIYNGNSFTTPSISSNTTYYAEASNNGCINTNRTAVNIIIYTPPAVTDETLVLCQSQKITLNAGIAGMNYLWSNGATTQTTEVNAGGKYTVVVTDPGPGSCSSTKTVTIEEHLKPEIDKIDVAGTRAIINTTKPQDYFEYSVDGVNFQDSNIFYDVPGGLQTAYVREKSGCGQDTQQFVVLVFPAFFTPNNDSYNDVWEVTGMENYPQAQVTIFDRYGKLIANLNHSKMSWDGTFERTPLPASDYWYALKIDNTLPVLRGHFSLKR